jgi:AraC-like DNA-binding protein
VHPGTSGTLPAAGRDGPQVGPHERLLWTNASMALGTFSASPENEDFETAGAIGGRPAIAFPRTSVRVAQASRTPFVTDRTMAVLHNPRHPFRRFKVDPHGDQCEWLSIDPELLLSMNSQIGKNPIRPFWLSYVPLDRRTNALLRLVVRHLQDWTPPDELWIEETLMEVVRRLAPGENPRPPRALARHDRIIQRVRETLSSRPEQRWTLKTIADAAGASTFHLCRVFRQRTGYTIHRYLTELRLRTALSRLEDYPDDLLGLAVELGFANHSHFTTAFRASLGVTPSEFRQRATPSGVRELGRRLRTSSS